MNNDESSNKWNSNKNQLSAEDEKLITSLVIAYYNSGVEFDYMNEKTESLKFYKLAYDLSVKELGPNAYLTHTLSERLLKCQSDAAASTNPSEKDTLSTGQSKLSLLNKKLNKLHKRRRQIQTKHRKQLNLSSLFGEMAKNLSKSNTPIEKEHSVSRLSNTSGYKADNSFSIFNVKKNSAILCVNSDRRRDQRLNNLSRDKFNNSVVTINPRDSFKDDRMLNLRGSKRSRKRQKRKQL